MNTKNIIMTVITVALISSCAAPHHRGANRGSSSFNKKNTGTVLGAVGGALAAKSLGKGTGKVLSIALGTLLGAYVGTEIGASLDKADMNYYNKTSQVALESNKIGQRSEWVNPDSGHKGTITPTKTVLREDKKTYCREFTQTVTIAGQSQQAYGEACRAPDGTWRIVQQ